MGSVPLDIYRAVFGQQPITRKEWEMPRILRTLTLLVLGIVLGVGFTIKTTTKTYKYAHADQMYVPVYQGPVISLIPVSQ